MTNREKFGEKILDIICAGEDIAINEKTNEPCKCNGLPCSDCSLDYDCSNKQLSKWLNAEYTEPQIDWSKVAVDTPVLVKMYETAEWEKRYFAEYKDGIIFTFSGGRTSWSRAGDLVSWKLGKLAEVGNE